MFSVNVSAESNGGYHVYSGAYVPDVGSGYFNELTFFPYDGTVQFKIAYQSIAFRQEVFLNHDHYFSHDDDSYIFRKGTSYSVAVENLTDFMSVVTETGSNYKSKVPFTSTIGLKGESGKFYYIAPIVAGDDKGYSVKFDYTPEEDCKLFVVWVQFRVTMPTTTGGTLKVYSELGEAEDTNFKLTIKENDPNTGLLSGILGGITSGFSALGEKLNNVWSSITDGFAKLGNILNDVWNAIKELPSKLWALIEEGLTNLFVPSEESMEEFKTKFETMLEEKYGAVWEVVQITFGSWENINASDLKNTISVPKVEIPLPDDNSFSFGGKEVKVIPDGFETIADICKMMSGAFCTLMFINGLRKRYDEVMAVEK